MPKYLSYHQINKGREDGSVTLSLMSLQVGRLVKRDGCSKEEAHAKIASQMPLAIKRERSTFTIQNNGSKEEAADKAKS